jgi:drug/metabolite transporter (DMT)-like permease
VLAACVLSFLGAAILVGTITIVNGKLMIDLFALGKGELITFLGTICFTISICLIDTYNKRGIREALNPGMFIGTVVSTTLAAFLVGCFIPESERILPTPFQGFASYTLLLQSWKAFSVFLFVVLFCTTFPFYWMNAYQGFFSPAHAALIYMLEPLSAAFWALWLPALLSAALSVVYPSEQLSFALVLGGGLIVLANLIPSLEE